MKKYKKAIIISFIIVLAVVCICIGSSYSFYKVDKKGQVHNKITTGDSENMCAYSNGNVWDFDYTGSEQEFSIPCYGKYKIETWGAQGGNSGGTGGYGGYSSGTAYFNLNDKLYINVGGQGATLTGGYNGGGLGSSLCVNGADYRDGAGGGGATHIANQSGLLSNFSTNLEDLFMVSGGGGGAAFIAGNYNGGSAGGYKGNIGAGQTYSIASGDQTTGYLFGQGQTGGACTAAGGSWGESGHGGGGGGFYGGFASQYTNNGVSAGGGGSGYIGNSLLTDKTMYCYNCTESSVESTKTVTTTCHSSTPTENCSKEGNGYAKITLIEGYSEVSPPTITAGGEFENEKIVSIITPGQSKNGIKYYEYFVTQENITPTKETLPSGITDEKIKITNPGTNHIYFRSVSNSNIKSFWSTASTVTIYECLYNEGKTWEFDYTGIEQSFSIPCIGTYKLETWGAQGGNTGTTLIGYGGYGGYSSGNISLKRNLTLYINVGGAGSIRAGGYNGGGTGGSSCKVHDNYSDGAGGGGATHIATQTGLLSSLSSNIQNIIMVSGGGGGSAYISEGYDGGSAGGFEGNQGLGVTYNIDAGNQTSGYAFGLGQNGGACTSASSSWGESGRGGAGGGFYGGFASQYTTNGIAPGAGGSGYIGNTLLTDKSMYCYNCTESSEESTKTVTTTCHSSTPTEKCSKEESGYARITLVSLN